MNYCNRIEFITCHTEFTGSNTFNTDGVTALTASDFAIKSTVNSKKIKFVGGEKSGENDELTYTDGTDNLVFKYGYDDGLDAVRDLAAPQKDRGSFTPLIEGSTVAGSQTYTGSTKARYIRDGDLVHVDIRVTLSAFDVATSGSIHITGLPYSCKNDVEVSGNVGIVTNITLPASTTAFGCYMNEGDNFIRLIATGAAFANINHTNMSATSNIIVSITYRTSDPTLVT